MLRLSAILIGALTLLPGISHAMGNIKLGKMAIHPSVGIEERYDSNIYLVPENLGGVPAGQNAANTCQTCGVIDAMITDLKLGLTFDLPLTEMHAFKAGYSANWVGYNKQQSQNNTVHQNANLGYDYKGPMGIYANLSDVYKNTEDPAFSELVGRSARWQNDAGMKLGYRPTGGRLFAEISGGHTRHKYVDENGNGSLGNILDRIHINGGAKLGYYVQPKTRLFLSYGREMIHYTNAGGRGKDNNSHSFGAGLEGKLAPKVRIELNTGVTTRHYDATAQATTFQTTNSINWYAGVKTHWKPSDRCDFSLSYRRAVEESTFSNNRFYVANKVDVNTSHRFQNKFKFNMGVGWGVDKYSEASSVTPSVAPAGITAVASTGSRRDDTYTLKTGLDYKIQDWITAYVKYQYDQRFSIFSGQYNYKRHMPAVGLRATF